MAIRKIIYLYRRSWLPITIIISLFFVTSFFRMVNKSSLLFFNEYITKESLAKEKITTVYMTNPLPSTKVAISPIKMVGSVSNDAAKNDIKYSKNDSDIKYILFWNEAYGSKTYGWSHGREKFIAEGCQENRCVATDKRTERSLNSFDAIFFHQRSLTWNDVPNPNLRKKTQKYVHWMFEAPIHIKYDMTSLKTLENFFNWTFTYRRDSTFFRPYGAIRQVKTHPNETSLVNYISSFGAKNTHLGKSKNSSVPIAWFASNCHSESNREEFVKNLTRYIGVDVYGGCGPLDCPRANSTNCFHMLEQKYRFYLSLENAICRDYITEKFFSIAQYKVIPVTLNGAEMAKIAPPNSYVNVLDFQTVKDLADYLLILTKNDKMYASYFWWKDFYSVSTGSFVEEYCDVCAALHETQEKVKSLPSDSSKIETPSNMYKWWVEDAQCYKPIFH